MKLGVYILLTILAVVGRAHAEAPSLKIWTDGILERLPFKDGALNHDSYRGYTHSFVEDKKLYFDVVFGRLLDKAERKRMTARADELRQDHERRIRELTANVDLATEAVFSTLDLNKDGIVSHAEARTAIRNYASAADLNDDGFLDTDEQALAEWALSTGSIIASKTDVSGLREQFREMERTTW
jgi:hypothetical protein